MNLSNFCEGMTSLILGNSRMTVLRCCVAASAQDGSTSLVTTRRIAKRDAPSVTGTRKSSSATPVRAVATQMAGRSSMARLCPTTRAERPVLTTTKRQAMLDKPLLTAKIILFLITHDRHTNNTRRSRSHITNLSNADSRPPIHRRTRKRCLKHRHTPHPTTARTGLLPS
jgi:hypothetical protein